MTQSRRNYKRKKITIPFTYNAEETPLVASSVPVFPLESSADQDETQYSGSMTNSSVDGFCFQTEKKLKEGTEIHASTAGPDPLELGSTRLESCRATVKWCHKEKGSKGKGGYSVGVQKVRTERLPIIDLKKRNFGSIKCT